MALVALAPLAFASAASAGDDAPPTEVAPVEVIRATPLGGELDIDKVAAPVQTTTAADLQASHALDLSAFLTRRLSGVYVNDLQNNPLQPDLNYRGFTASPLLGTPQGLSVYVDGMRFNQPFGDVVSWDLIPRLAIADIALVPGSNPLFGLNTLGGALSVHTKDGRTHPGGSVQLSAGSPGRQVGEAEFGGAWGGFDAYATVTGFKEDGWRDASPSNAVQGFAKLGWSDGRTRIALSGAFARTDLQGNGLQEQRFLKADRDSVYTKPDITQNQSGFGNLTFEHDAGGGLSFSGNAYWRDIRSRTYNGDINDGSLTGDVYDADAGETAANTPFPSARCLDDVLNGGEPDETCNGLVNRTHTRQREAGFGVQASHRSEVGGRTNQLLLGLGYRQTRARFEQSSQFGYLTPDRGIIPAEGPDAFDDDAEVDLAGRTRTLSLFVSDTLDVTPTVALTLSARYDADDVHNRDAITPGGGPGSLDGRHTFDRLNPAVGFTWKVADAVTAYAGLSQGGRAPSVIELGCADPEHPCRLPNALAGDPPLKQVRTVTGEVGLRGRMPGVTWNAGLFRGENHDDILFVADDTSGFGYFKNFGRTRREGAELGVEGQWGRVTAGANYTYLKATYRSAETVGGAGNSSNDTGPGFEGDIVIAAGDRIPLVPKHLFKANVAWAVTDTLDLSADLVASSGVYARGNENNEHQPDGVYDLGPGKTKGYAVVNAGADWRPVPGFEVFVQVSNLFDKHYETAAQLGPTGFTDTGAFVARPFAGPVIDGERPVRNATFYAPGAPRTVSIGLRYAFGGR